MMARSGEAMVTMELRGLDGVVDALNALPKELYGKGGGAVRAAMRKGARRFLKRLDANLGAVTANADSAGKKASTGLLKKNLTITRAKHIPGGGKGERYFVRIRRKGYPQRENVSTLKTANLLEFGSSQQPAEPWMRPAFSAEAAAAIKDIEGDIVAAVERLTRKASKK